MASVLVTGGSSGIGRAAVRAFRDRGDSVVIADLDLVHAKRVADEDRPGPAWAVRADMASREGPAAAVQAAVTATGGSLDIVIANAGVLIARPLSQWTPELWDQTMAVNLRSPFLLTQAAFPYLRNSPRPRVIMTSSTGAFRGHAGTPAYAASKAGLVNLARSLADELSPHGVLVNCVCPGWVDTPFNDPYWSQTDDPSGAADALVSRIPMRRQATPEEIVGTMLFLASDAAAYITGQSFVVDGGQSAV